MNPAHLREQIRSMRARIQLLLETPGLVPDQLARIERLTRSIREIEDALGQCVLRWQECGF